MKKKASFRCRFDGCVRHTFSSYCRRRKWTLKITRRKGQLHGETHDYLFTLPPTINASISIQISHFLCVRARLWIFHDATLTICHGFRVEISVYICLIDSFEVLSTHSCTQSLTGIGMIFAVSQLSINDVKPRKINRVDKAIKANSARVTSSILHCDFDIHYTFSFNVI